MLNGHTISVYFFIATVTDSIFKFCRTSGFLQLLTSVQTLVGSTQQDCTAHHGLLTSTFSLGHTTGNSQYLTELQMFPFEFLLPSVLCTVLQTFQNYVFAGYVTISSRRDITPNDTYFPTTILVLTRYLGLPQNPTVFGFEPRSSIHIVLSYLLFSTNTACWNLPSFEWMITISSA